MKGFAPILLALLLLLSMTACGGEEPYYDDPVEPVNVECTLDTLSGWWRKPDGYAGITVMPIFSLDPANATITVHDDYGNPLDTYDCWCDDAGLTIDAGEVFGLVTYTYDGYDLLDEEGTVHYVRCDPISPDDAPVQASDLVGIWYENGKQNGNIDIGADSYTMYMMLSPADSGPYSVTSHKTYYSHTEYSGPAVIFSSEDGFSTEMYIVEEGKVLFDDYHGYFYVQDPEDTHLVEKYGYARDIWQHQDGELFHELKFHFSGEVWFSTTEDGGSYETQTIGTWDYADGAIILTYSDGSVETFDAAGGFPEELTSELLGYTFSYWEAW